VSPVRRSILLTHTDLDGVGCAVVFAGVRGAEGAFELVENGAIDARVTAVLLEREAAPAAAEVIVADHGLSGAVADLVDGFVAAGGSFTLLDHHRSAAPLASRTWATIDEGRSATGLLQDHLGKAPAYAEFAALVEDHDLWRHTDPRSARLAALLGLLGHQRFLARFAADPEVRFSAGEELLLEVEDARREEFISRRVEQARTFEVAGVRWAYCFADQYQSDLAERLMTALGVGATAIVNPSKRTISLRSRDFDVAALAGRFGGGGHARAAAFSFRDLPLEADLAAFESSLERALGG